MVRRATLVLVLIASACSGDNGPNSGTAGSSGGGGNAPDDASTADTSTPDASTVGDSSSDLSDGWTIKTIKVLIDEVQGGASSDGGPSSDARLLLGPSVARRDSREALRPQWPFQYSFDTGVDGWELAPFWSGSFPVGGAIAHNPEDFSGATTSGSLEVSWTFDIASSDANQRGMFARAFSEASGPPRDWTGYRVALRAKPSPTSAACPTAVGLYVLSGSDRKVWTSSHSWLSSRGWQMLELDLNGVPAADLDPTQITEFGVTIARDLCAPPP